MPVSDATHLAFYDELSKIAEISLSGISHENVMRMAVPAPPMETAGLSKALAVLDRYTPPTQTKVAFFADIANPNLPQLQRATGVSRKKKSKDKNVAQQTGSATAHTIGGMGAGRLLSDFAAGSGAVHPKKLRKITWRGMAAGGALGATTYIGKRLARRHTEQSEKTAFVTAGPGLTPGLAKKSGGATAKLTRFARRSAGPGAISRLATKI